MPGTVLRSGSSEHHDYSQVAYYAVWEQDGKQIKPQSDSAVLTACTRDRSNTYREGRFH